MPRRQRKKDGLAPSVRPVEEEELAVGNQWQSTPRQQAWLNYYMDPRSETWGNAYQSAIKAGYSESYAGVITKDSTALDWVKQAKNIMRLNPEHLKAVLQDMIHNPMTADRDKLRAVELLGKDQGMFVQKTLVGIVPLEQALNDLE